MQNRYRPVILTRPGAANDRLADLLEADGLTVWRWPAFTITLPEDQALVAERFAHLDDVEMVVMASPAAVTAVAHWVREWPKHITLATVGEGTAKVIRAAWGDDVKIIYPEGDAEHSGSEALFALVKKQHDKAVGILTDNREKLDELAKFLYEKETITGEEFMEILDK